jgi:hypothetical protein
MLEMGGGFRFTAKSKHFLFARELACQNHLQRDDAVQTELPRAIDDAHSTAADFIQQFKVAKAAGRPGLFVGDPFAAVARFCGQRALERALRAKPLRPVFRQRNTALGASTRFPCFHWTPLQEKNSAKVARQRLPVEGDRPIPRK